MKNTIFKLQLVAVSAFILLSCSAQNSSVAETKEGTSDLAQTASKTAAVNTDLPFGVNINFPYISITRAELHNAQTLSDLDSNYKTSWIRTYNSVKISVLKNGKSKSVLGSSYKLTSEQKELIKSADADSPISVKVKYMPENNLSQNDEQEITFTTKVTPETPASFPGGQDQLLAYIYKKAITKIPEGTFQGYDLATIIFTISETGEVRDVQVFEPYISPSSSEELLQSVLSEMPNWSPAQYTDGTKVSQNFVLTVGNTANCKIHMLEIRG